jgi:hypothetical protein
MHLNPPGFGSWMSSRSQGTPERIARNSLPVAIARYVRILPIGHQFMLQYESYFSADGRENKNECMTACRSYRCGGHISRSSSAPLRSVQSCGTASGTRVMGLANSKLHILRRSSGVAFSVAPEGDFRRWECPSGRCVDAEQFGWQGVHEKRTTAQLYGAHDEDPWARLACPGNVSAGWTLTLC